MDKCNTQETWFICFGTRVQDDFRKVIQVLEQLNNIDIRIYSDCAFLKRVSLLTFIM